MREWLVVYLKGFCMGAADAVPGVSGGTIAFITGIYERLVDAIANIDPGALLSTLPLLARVHDGRARTEAWSVFERMDLPFLAVLGVGVVSAAVTVANVFEHLSEAYPAMTYAFFFGLIVASVVVLADEAHLDSPRRALAGVAGFALAFTVSGVAVGGALDSNPATLFVVGAVAISAMVLPGVSGSLILLALGQYTVMTGAVEELTDAALGLADGGAVAALVDPLVVLVVFSLGALVGLLTFAHVVSWALDTYRAATLTFLVALMAGALRAPAERILDAVDGWTPSVVAGLVAAAVAGAAVVFALDYASGEIEY